MIASGGTFADAIAAEEARIAAGTAPACGFTCACHGNIICVRALHDNYGDHWVTSTGDIVLPGADVPEGSTWVPEARVPHVGRDAAGELVQYCGPHLTAEQLAAAQQRAQVDNVQRTKDILDSLDPATVAAFLASVKG